MKKKKIRLLVSAAVVLILLFYSADMVRNWNELVGSTEETKDEKENVNLSWYVNYSWFEGTWGKNQVSKKITEETGVTIDFVVPKGDESEKLNSVIEADALPDLVTLGWWEPENYKMISEGYVYALNELADTYDVPFLEHAKEDTVKWYTKADGNIYGYPNYSCTYEEYLEGKVFSNQNFLVRKDIYEALGCPDMSTPEGFRDAVKRAAELFPEVDGKPLIPIGADEFTDNGNNSFDAYLQNFLAVPYEQDGKYYDRNTDAEYLRWLKVFRQLGEEGYLKDEIFVDKRSQLEEKIQAGRYFCLFYQSTDIEDQEKLIYQEAPERIYIAVEGPRNSRGEDPVLPVRGINGWTVTYISKNCKNPEKAIEFMTYMLSEEVQKTIYYGVEPAMYEEQEGMITVKEEVQKLLNTDRKAYDELYGADDTYWMLKDSITDTKWKDNQFSLIDDMQKWTRPYTAYTGQYDMNFEEDSESALLHSRLQNIWSETLPKLLLAKNEEAFDSIIDEYCRRRTENGYEEFCRKAEEIFRENKERLGIQE